jgi:hypothetical protein
MSSYEFLPGTPLANRDISTDALDRIAEYCAFRVSEFRSDRRVDRQFDEMVRFNFSQETGRECPVTAENLQPGNVVIADNRMSPHEWIGCADGSLMKVDGSRHGDDHFFPGPTDIAWDLAGAIIEWEMDAAAEEYFLRKVRAMSGIIPDRLPAFLIAYSVFCACYCKMAWMGTGVESEKPRLQNAYGFYRRKMADAVRRLDAVAAL